MHLGRLLLGEKLFLPSMLVCLSSVCLSVCVCHMIFGHSFQAISLKFFFLCVGDPPRTVTFNFGEDPQPDLDLRILKVILHH